MTDMIDEYFKIFKESVEKYGEKTTVIYACGSFYEIYSVENQNEKIGNAQIVANIINCEFSNKNKVKRAEQGFSTRTFCDFCGFVVDKKSKFVPLLLNENYTVVEVDQLEDSKNKKGKLVKRGVVAVHSPSLKSPEFETIGDCDSFFCNLLLEYLPKNKQLKTDDILLYSLCSINNVTNEVEIYESSVSFDTLSFQVCIDEINRVLLRYNVKELRISFLGGDLCKNNIQNLMDSLVEFNVFVEKIDKTIYKEYVKPVFQNEYLAKVYQNVSFGLLSPLEYFNLISKELSALNLMYTFDFIGRHSLSFLTNLSIPQVVEDGDNLILALNTLSQLNILSKSSGNKTSSVFDCVNNTCTAIGTRYLRNILSKPFRDPRIMNKRYELTEILRQSGKSEDINKLLCVVVDFERLHRKMSLKALHPHEFEKLHLTYNIILQLIHLVNGILDIVPSDEELNRFDEFITEYTTTFDVKLLRGISLHTSKENMINFFNEGEIVELDKIVVKIKHIEETIENIRQGYCNKINEKSNQQLIKLEYTDQDGYFMKCTKIRFEKLKNILNKNELSEITKTKTTNNDVKLFTNMLSKLSLDLVNNRQLLATKVKVHYINKTQEYSNKYRSLFTSLKCFIEILDITCSNLKCAVKHNYCKPTLLVNSASFIKFYQLRHPIIERISQSGYITNDLTLNSETVGMLMYGLNSCGKSSLLRAIGVNLVLAQAGLYTSCTNFEFSPFSTLISQVDLSDNLFGGKSSFINEMVGLRKILSYTSSSTLCLADEMCKGTESASAVSLVTATIMELIKTDTKFFFTSHLHGIPDIDCIKSETKLRICHLSMDITDNNIVFNRKIEEGSGPSIYGLEVCRSIIKDKNFIDTAFKIRNSITECRTSVISDKKSNYNQKKRMDCCQICGYIPTNNKSIPLETHHISEQKGADSKGFVKGKHTTFHKNEIYNLVSLCKECHQKITNEEMICDGYIETTDGIKLSYRLK